MVAEVLDKFVQYQLTIVAHQPPFDAETRQHGLRRHSGLMNQAARQLGVNRGQPRLIELITDRKSEK
jgi:hypothetical protein